MQISSNSQQKRSIGRLDVYYNTALEERSCHYIL